MIRIMNYDEIFSKAREYVDTYETAQKGEMGYAIAFRLVSVLWAAFDLDDTDILLLMLRWSERCPAQWTGNDFKAMIGYVSKNETLKAISKALKLVR